MSQPKKSANPKVTIIASKGANQAINYLLEDRDELEWLVRNSFQARSPSRLRAANGGGKD